MSETTTQTATDKELLERCVEFLLYVGCQFFACEGYEKVPEDMITCGRCRMLHDIFAVHPEEE